MICKDKRCPFHAKLSTRGRIFEGTVKKISPGNRAVVEFPRVIYYKKYERYVRTKTRIHAHIPACLSNKIEEGSKVKIAECRPLSKMIHFVVIEIKK
ncbi:MAG: 30S ribosomal protein S17 [Candidatus Pacearchaeota archaeon]|nr:30S ribosomal protein S17 [Candidatus Pacearchaeota archaeon]